MNQTKRTLLIAAILLAIFPYANKAQVRVDPNAKPRSATFKYKPLETGTVRKSESNFEMNLNVHAIVAGARQEFPIDRTRKETRVETWIAAAKGASIKLNVVYTTFNLHELNALGAEAANPKPEQNKNYLLEKVENAWKASAADKSTLGAGETAFLAEDYDAWTFDTRFFEALNGRTIKEREEVKMDKEFARSLLSSWKNVDTIKNFTVTLIHLQTEDGVECALFDIMLRVTGKFGPSLMEMDMNGNVLVPLQTCQPIRIDLQGPIMAQAANPDMIMTGDGMIRGMRQFKYSMEKKSSKQKH
jgi:hypothetical protein